NYRYHVICQNATGNSAFSSATTMTLAIAPSGLTASSTDATTVHLSWTDNSSAESGFAGQRSSNGGSAYPTVPTIAANSTSYSDTDATGATSYLYRIFAINASGDSAASASAAATTP